MTRYLITGIGGDIAQGIARIIRSYEKDAFITGTDISTQHAGHLFVDEFIETLPAANSQYIDRLKDIIKKFEIMFLIPTTEPEIEMLVKHLKEFEDVKVLYPGKKVVEECLDKYKTNKFLSSLGIDVPWTYTDVKNDPIQYPCIFKPRKGSGSKILFQVQDASEAEFLQKKYDECIFQELLLPKENEITCPVFRSSKGLIHTIQLQRLLYEGTTSWAKVVFYEEIDALCEKVAQSINLNGSMNIQLRLTDSGPKIFEINPRFSSTVYMRHLVGFQDLIWNLQDMLGEDIEYTQIKKGIQMVRTQSGEILN